MNYVITANGQIENQFEMSDGRVIRTPITRSRVGVYHRGLPANCNQRMKVGIARASDVQKASASSFCEKCFNQATTLASV